MVERDKDDDDNDEDDYAMTTLDWVRWLLDDEKKDEKDENKGDDNIIDTTTRMPTATNDDVRPRQWRQLTKRMITTTTRTYEGYDNYAIDEHDNEITHDKHYWGGKYCIYK